MNFSFLLILLLIVLNSGMIYAEIEKSNLENSSLPIEEFRSSSSSKIHSILLKWQTSENPNEFAKENNLSFRENKIGVYIYLESAESISKIPNEITITAFDEKIIVAFVNSDELDKLEELDFIERITPPDLVRTPPIPKVEIAESQIPEEKLNDYLLWIIIVGIIVITIVIFKNRKKL